MKKFGYVFSGGGARGFAHLGLIKLLEELGIKPYAIAGTSVGAVIGVLYAAGKTPMEILQIMKNNTYFGWSNILWRRSGFFSMKALEELLHENVGKDDFDALKVKLFVTATDLVSGHIVIFSKGKLFQPVIASASVPILFKPVIIGDKILVDGGVMNNLPIEPLESICDIIIASHVNKAEEGINKASLVHPFNILERCFHLAIASSVYSKLNRCDLFVEPPLNSFEMYDVKKAQEIFEIGYGNASKHKEKLLSLINKKKTVINLPEIIF
jgi:NTE family protein